MGIEMHTGMRLYSVWPFITWDEACALEERDVAEG